VLSVGGRVFWFHSFSLVLYLIFLLTYIFLVNSGKKTLVIDSYVLLRLYVR